MSKNMDIAILLDVYGGMLTEKQSDALSLYYNEDLSLTEIAENYGITRQGVHKCIRSAEDYLLQLEQTLGYAEKYRTLYAIADRLDKLTDGGAYKDKKTNSEIKECIDKIRATI